MPPKTKSKPDPIKNIIETSGNNFHFKVVEKLRAENWIVQISPFYNDNFSEKPREIDIIAEKPFRINYFPLDIYKGHFNFKFFIECKYIPKDVIFWFDEKDKIKAKKKIIDETPFDRLSFAIKDLHHLQEDFAAKLFTSNQDKKFENEVFYQAINQSLNALIFGRDKGTIIDDEIYLSKYKFREELREMLNLPIIVCNNFSHLYKVDNSKKGYSKITEPYFQLEIDYSYQKKYGDSVLDQSEYFLIDVVDFSRIDEYFEILGKDIDIIDRKLSFDVKDH